MRCSFGNFLGVCCGCIRFVSQCLRGRITAHALVTNWRNLLAVVGLGVCGFFCATGNWCLRGYIGEFTSRYLFFRGGGGTYRRFPNCYHGCRCARLVNRALRFSPHWLVRRKLPNIIFAMSRESRSTYGQSLRNHALGQCATRYNSTCSASVRCW